uniref:Uncharacterized protein n=1 Tax=Nelumbo nucifera TaxID=4432 RepID=A0A822Y5B1_NELNU|nr:TPA_asm: hypothetical protein HUJ06_030602 [Nelumbo nucifera]
MPMFRGTMLNLLLSMAIFFGQILVTISVSDIHLGNPTLQLTPLLLPGYSSSHGSKDVVSCGRVHVTGLSRLKIKSYANAFRVTLTPSIVIPDKFHGKIGVCFHQNASLGLCQCTKDEWKAIQKGSCSTVMSPYGNRYVDVRFNDGISGSVTVSVEEEFQKWRLFCLALGFILLLLAPIVSNWVPFYYSSSMAIGIFLVILIILFQGMKLLPTGRKNFFYLTLYGSVVGAGSYIVHYLSMLVNSVLVNFGLSEEMYNPVYVFALVGIILAGAGLGYWIVRKFVISEDGGVDAAIAQFVKWAMRIMAMTLIFQSTLDIPLAMMVLASASVICLIIRSLNWRQPSLRNKLSLGNGSLWSRRNGHAYGNHNRAEFLSRSTKVGSQRAMWNTPRSSFAWSNSPTKCLAFSSPPRGTNQQDYYSTFHKTPTRKRFSKKEWDDFTRESTRQAIAEWASSPEFTDWIIEHADRVQLLPEDSSDDSMESGSASSEETMVENGNGFNLFKWY